MARRKTNRMLPMILVLLAIALAIAVLISVARAIFLPSSDGKNDKKPVETLIVDPQEALLNTSADRGVSLVARGPIVAQEAFRSYKMVITPSSRKLTLYEGYLDTVVDTWELSNNLKAYTQFVYALDKAGLTAGTPLGDDKNDTRGVCATGEIYSFSLLKDYQKESVANYWTSTCSGSPGSLKASAKQLIDLFVVQIPESREILKNVNVYSS